MMSLLKILVVIIVALGIALLVAGQAGLLRGAAPTDLGLKNGQLKPPANSPNSVSSQAALHASHPFRAYADIAPLAYTGDGAAALAEFARAVAIVKAMPGATVVNEKPGYVYAQCQTRWLKFTDDLELALDASERVIHVRSASRIGRGDLGVNRARVEAIRAAMASG